MKKKIIILALVAGICPAAIIHAQEVWTLRQCIDYAIAHNVSIRQTENTADQSKIDVNTAKWARLPSLNGSASQNYSWGRAASPVDNSYINTNSGSSNFGLSTNIPLFTGLQIPNQYALSKINFKAAIEDLKKAKEDLSINVASSYLQVLFNKELLKVAQEQVTLSKEQYARVAKLAELGKSSISEVAEAKARIAQDEVSSVQADNDYRLSLLQLSQLLELPTPEGFTLDAPDANPVFAPITPPDDIYVQAMSSKPGILAAKYRLEGSEKSIRIAQSGYYPQLSFGAGLSTGFYTLNGKAGENFSKQLDNNLNKYIGFSLSIPLFDRFSTRNNVRSARLRQANYSLQLESVKKDLYKEIQQAWYNAVAAESKYNSSTLAVTANEESFRLMEEKYENGKATAVEYNEAKLNLMKAVSDRLQAKYDYMFRTKILDFYKGQPIQ
ncbi:TolC family protein [uncultured Bacteroides sp.]|uniref:TolC family protein n=1 Tax=uncultured Bacteroides sp. TaxID=162156 RepID=UPI002AA61D90|nr:TolC family protein [uncultured Bacteroides sp.]